MSLSDLVHRFREWMGIPETPDAEKRMVERELQKQTERLARIDAGLPPIRRGQLYPHPHRRASDRR